MSSTGTPSNTGGDATRNTVAQVVSTGHVTGVTVALKATLAEGMGRDRFHWKCSVVADECMSRGQDTARGTLVGAGTPPGGVVSFKAT
jgi:hypothetical protein